jgi:hypothetical protein
MGDLKISRKNDSPYVLLSKIRNKNSQMVIEHILEIRYMGDFKMVVRPNKTFQTRCPGSQMQHN